MFRDLKFNLDPDWFVQHELMTAGIIPIRGSLKDGEVQTRYTGELDYWRFERANSYYYAKAIQPYFGMPLEKAIELHETPYPSEGTTQPSIYGQVLRVGGDAGAPHPKDFYGLKHVFDDFGKRQAILDPDGSLEAGARKFYKMDINAQAGMVEAFEERFSHIFYVKSLDMIPGIESFVDCYHVDTQLGLNKLAETIRYLRKR